MTIKDRKEIDELVIIICDEFNKKLDMGIQDNWNDDDVININYKSIINSHKTYETHIVHLYKENYLNQNTLSPYIDGLDQDVLFNMSLTVSESEYNAEIVVYLVHALIEIPDSVESITINLEVLSEISDKLGHKK